MAELANPLCWAARAIDFDTFGWRTTVFGQARVVLMRLFCIADPPSVCILRCMKMSHHKLMDRTDQIYFSSSNIQINMDSSPGETLRICVDSHKIHKRDLTGICGCTCVGSLSSFLLGLDPLLPFLLKCQTSQLFSPESVKTSQLLSPECPTS